ncbi:hypothetical protein GCM10007424_25580 [Flavobacterium suaedae]|uniref:Sugar-binding protein n=2 Tax=Flavobacterium suaedae TaxID=1767027 RepID=A0ABQ1K4W9_9FLAO|nr:hypothetical protein GCM10007424_25580 [Flavobacterium suaedae]
MATPSKSTTIEDDLHRLRNFTQQNSVNDDIYNSDNLLSQIPDQLPTDSLSRNTFIKLPICESLEGFDVKGPIKELMIYSLGSWGDNADSVRDKQGNVFYLSNRVMFHHTGRVMSESKYGYKYFFDANDNMLMADLNGDVRRYYYNKDHLPLYCVIYDKNWEDLHFEEVHFFENNYATDRTEVKTKMFFYEDAEVYSDYAIYNFNGDVVYQRFSSLIDNNDLESLYEYQKINRKQFLKKEIQKAREGRAKLNELYEYDSKGNVLKSYINMGPAEGNLTEITYLNDNEYKQTLYRLKGSSITDPFVYPYRIYLSETKVTLDNKGNILTREYKDSDSHSFDEFESEYDQYGNKTFLKHYQSNISSNDTVKAERTLKSSYIYKIKYYKKGEKAKPYIPNLNNKREMYNKRIIDSIQKVIL